MSVSCSRELLQLARDDVVAEVRKYQRLRERARNFRLYDLYLEYDRKYHQALANAIDLRVEIVSNEAFP